MIRPNPPIIGQQQAHAQAAIQAAIQQLSLGNYTRLAAADLTARGEHAAAGDETLQQLAADSMVAARAYFLALGVIEQEADGNGKAS